MQGADDEVLRRAADEADTCELHDVREIAGKARGPRRDHRHDRRAGERGVDDQRLRALVRGEPPRPELVRAQAGCGGEERQRGGLKDTGARADDDERSAEPDRHRQTPPRPHPLLQQRRRERDDDERRGEHDCGRGGDLHVGQRRDEQAVRDEEHERAPEHLARAARAQQRGAESRPEEQGCPDQMPQKARPHDLGEGIVGGERFRQRGHGRQQAHPEQHVRDAGSRVAAGTPDHRDGSAPACAGRRQGRAPGNLGRGA